MANYSDVLLTADFDRTLTAPDSSLPERNLEAIRHFIDGGGAFTVNTGRSVAMYRKYMEQIPVNAPLLLYNGSAAYDAAAGDFAFCRTIDLPMWPTITYLLERYPDMNLEFQGVNCHYIFREMPMMARFYAANNCAYRIARPGDDLGPFVKLSLFGEIREPNVSHLFGGSPEELARIDGIEAELRRTFGDRITVFRSGARILDIHAFGVSKAACARDLLNRLGRKILVCIGDAENDVPMLQDADFAFCPADGVIASRFPTVCPCADGAVADVIYEKIPALPG